jgi:hypothetical protein
MELDHLPNRIAEMTVASPFRNRTIVVVQVLIHIGLEIAGGRTNRVLRHFEVVVDIVAFIKVNEKSIPELDCGKQETILLAQNTGNPQHYSLGAALVPSDNNVIGWHIMRLGDLQKEVRPVWQINSKRQWEIGKHQPEKNNFQTA